MSIFLQTIVSGLCTGLLYSLLALGLTMSFGIGNLVNFAQGDFMIVGAMVTGSAFGAVAGDSAVGGYLLAAAIALAVVAALACVCHYGVFRFTVGRPMIGLVVSFGLVQILESGEKLIWGAGEPAIGDAIVPGRLRWGSFSVPWVSLLAAGVAIVALVAYFLVLHRLPIGRAWRAMAQDSDVTMLLGVPTARYRAINFVVGTGLAAVVGALLILSVGVTSLSGIDLVAVAFAAIIVGGPGDPRGAVAGGLIIGIGEAITGVYLDASYIRAFGMGAVVLVLLFRPHGLWGGAERAF